MTSRTANKTDRYVKNPYPQQGHWAGWTLWALLALLSLLGLSSEAHAGTFSPSQTTFPATSVGSTSAPTLITLTAKAAGTATAPIALTEGVSTLSLAEFTITGAGTCGSSPSLSAGQSCTVSATFSPRYPGMRHGAMQLKTSSGQLLASTLLSGLGQGSLPVLIPGQISTVVGDGNHYYQTDGVPATQTSIYLPSGLAVDAAGNLYLADSINNRIRKVDAATQNITTIAGNGYAGSTGDGGPATSAEITTPSGIALDGAGNLYIADTGNNTIRRVDALSGVITTVAGTPGTSGYTGDGGLATSATLRSPQAIALAPDGDLVIADTANAAVRVLTASDGKIQTIAGTGTPGFNGDGVTATSAQLNDPSGVAIRQDGAIAIADLSNNRVRLVTVGGTISTIAGNGTPGYSGDGSSATQAELQGPAAVVFDPAGDLLIADNSNNCVRLVYGAPGTIVTLTGTPSDDRFAGDGGPDNQARLHGPDGLFFDAGGNLWISDSFNNRVREVNGSLLTIGPYPTMKVGKTSQPVPETMLNAGNQPLTLSAPALQQASLDTATTTCGQASLSPSVFCDMGVEFAPTSVGATVNGSITWASNAPNVTPVDDLYGQVLTVEPTTTALSSSANPGLLGQPVTLTATVTSADTGRTGTVDFVEGTTTWCHNVLLGANGTASCQIPSLSLGNHSFTGNYSGDNNNAASQSPVFQEVIKQQAALALGVSSSPATVTNNVTLTLSTADSTGTPTGTATFYDGATVLATVPLDASGNASWSTTTFSVGTHTLSAHYSGDGANVPGTSNTKVLEVDQASTVTVLSSGNNNATVGANVTLTANVVANNGPAPTGNVRFLDGTTVLGSTPLASNGSAAFALNTLSPGTHSLTAVYSGDTDDASSTSAAITQTIQQIGTVTTLGADVDPANAGATVHFSAIVSLSPGATADGALTGSVAFSDRGTFLGSAALNASGEATLAVSTLAVGAHSITAHFSGSTNYAPSNSTNLTETVQQTPTSVALSSAASTTLKGQPVNLAALVTSSTGTPTGSVAFKEGSAVLGTVALDAHGSASFSTTTLPGGTHTITAVYGGDANYLAATSTGLQQTVNLAQPTLTLSGPPGAVDAGTAAQFTAFLSAPGVPPSGTLTLSDGSTPISVLSVASSGSFTFATSRLAVGQHLLTAAYSGDANNASATSAALTVTVQQASTATALSANANPLTQRQPLTLMATVTSDSPNQTNGVAFYDGPTLLGTAALNANGTATFTPPGITLGTHSLTAVYAGDSNHAGSTSATLPELVVQSASLSLLSSANPSVSGQSITFTAQINGNPAATGLMAFRSDGALLATVPLNAAGAASFPTTVLSVGTHAVLVTYEGDTNFSTAQGALTQVVLNASTITTFTVGQNPATYGVALPLQVTVSSNGGAATGTVTFFDAGAAIGSGQLDGSGHASLTIASLSPGAHTLQVNYAGDGNASPSISNPLALLVKQTTALAVSSDASPAQTLAPIQLTATITTAGAVPATGMVTFTDGSTDLGSASLDSAGHAVLKLAQLAAGTHVITATYVGDGDNFSSQSAGYNQVVQVRPTATTVTGIATDPANPQQITLIAVVRGAASVPPSGTVNFTSGAVTLGAAAVDPTGVATITVIFETPTQHVTAGYTGDAFYGASQSDATAITAGKPAQFTLSLDIPNVTLVSHQRTTLAVTVTSVKGFTDNIGLGCLGLPYAATCTFDHSQLKLNANGTATASLIIDTGNPLGAGTSTTAALERHSLLFCFSPAALLLTLLRRKGRRRIVPALLALLLTLACTSGLSGCSGLQMSGTPPGTYSFKVIGTGQGSNITEAQNVTLVVTQ